jgi:hypothetical protein
MKIDRGDGGWIWLTFFVFLGLKVAGLIDWSWWWVTAPLWVPLPFILALIIFALLFGFWDGRK